MFTYLKRQSLTSKSSETEGKQVHKNLSKKEKITAAFIAILLATTFMASLLPEVTATTVAISINPKSGHIGDSIHVNGTIITPNGNYTIFFNGTPVKNGTATNNEVNDIFTVPPNHPADNYNVTLQDLVSKINANATFTLEPKYYIKAVVPPTPKQLQESNSTTIWVNVTGGNANTVYVANITVKEPSPASSTFSTRNTVSLTNTTTTGYGNGSAMYPENFTTGANTNYAGVYTMLFFNKTQTLATGNFTVGLTNATEYHRFQVVGIQAANYEPNEPAWVNITFTGKTVFRQNVTAGSGGIINHNWTIPGNTSMGLYTVAVTNSTKVVTVKPVPDVQNFTIVEIPCQVRTQKLNGKALADVWVNVYNKTNGLIASNLTDEEGWASVSVEGGNYTFNASLPINSVYVPVGTLVNKSVTESRNITLLCWVAGLNITVSPPLPFINITMTYQNVTDSFETNNTGIWKIPNLPTNISYTIVAQRYGYPFSNETLPLKKLLPANMNVSWVNLTITVPTYTLFVQALDSKGSPINNVEVAVYEWSSGVAKPVQSNTTNDQGNASFHNVLFGKYKIWVYNPNQTIVLNETVVNLIQNQTLFVVHCNIYKVDLSVLVKDYFGKPISNALVKVEREVGAYTNNTGANGKALFENITGGEVQISVTINGKLCETKTVYVEKTMVVEFRLGGYVMVAGYPVGTVQFFAFISLGVLVALFALALIYGRLRTRKVSEGKEKSL
jgi:hypothetical protein